MKKIDFSVISPTYNASKSIQKTFDSIMCQQNVNIEYIVIDGGSTDCSIIQFEKWATQYENFRFISESDNGIYDAMNKGIQLAQGDYVIFLGAGDCLIGKSILERILKKFNERDADIVYGYVMFCYNDGVCEKYCRKINKTYAFRGDPISHQAIVTKRNLLLEYPFDISYKIAADQDWIMKMYKKRKRFVYIDLPIVDYDMYGVSASPEGMHKGNAELWSIHQRYYPCLFYIHDILRKLKKILKNR